MLLSFHGTAHYSTDLKHAPSASEYVALSAVDRASLEANPTDVSKHVVHGLHGSGEICRPYSGSSIRSLQSFHLIVQPKGFVVVVVLTV